MVTSTGFGALLDEAVDRIARQTAALNKIRELHTPYYVFDECDCTEEEKIGGIHVDVEDVGRTCNWRYNICTQCCVDPGGMSENCAACHDHGPDMPICPTIAIIEQAEL